MTIAGHTDGLISTDLWGEEVTIRRNTPTWSFGNAVDSWATVATVNADIQPVSPGSFATLQQGQTVVATHRFYFSDDTNIREGDRVRPNGWSAGDNEFQITSVMDDEGHYEVYGRIVKGSA